MIGQYILLSTLVILVFSIIIGSILICKEKNSTVFISLGLLSLIAIFIFVIVGILFVPDTDSINRNLIEIQFSLKKYKKLTTSDKIKLFKEILDYNAAISRQDRLRKSPWIGFLISDSTTNYEYIKITNIGNVKVNR